MNKELNQKVADKLEYEIENNFPIYDTYSCASCGHGVYIMHAFENLPDIIREEGRLPSLKLLKLWNLLDYFALELPEERIKDGLLV